MRADRQRLDKWLWFARFVKTRSRAARLVSDGYVRVNARRAEAASTPVLIGDVVTVATEHGTLLVRVTDLGTRRGPAEEARTLYAPVPATDEAAASS